MIKLMKAALAGVRAELTYGNGWQVVGGPARALSGPARVSDAGTTVSQQTILNLSTVWAAASATASLVSTLPLHLFEKSDDGTMTRIDDELRDIVVTRPNTYQTGVEFWDGMCLNMLLGGNSYAEKLRIGPRVVALRPLLNCVPKWTGNGFEYLVTEKGARRTLQGANVLHLRGFGAGDGLGLSAVQYGTQSLGAALAAEQTAGSVFRNAMMPSGLFEFPEVLTDDQREQAEAMLNRYTGSRNAGRAIILEGGITHKTVQWNPEDVELLATRRFQVEDICRWFGIPPIVIGHAADGQTMWGTGVEAIMLAWLTRSINPFLRRVEARLNVDLIPADRRGRWVFEFNREAMLQMDSKAKAEFLSKMGNSGTMTANERRARLNLPRSDDTGSDQLLVQTALAPLETLMKDSET